MAWTHGLEKLDLCDTMLTRDQVSAIFSMLASEESWNDLSSVPTKTLVTVISGLEEARLMKTELTRVQLTGIYSMLADKECSRLRLIDLGGNHLSSISPDLHHRASLNQSVKLCKRFSF